MSPINLRGIESSSPTKFQHVYLRVPCISPASAVLLSTSYSLLNEAPLGTLSKREWHLLHQDRMKNKKVFLMTYSMDVLSIKGRWIRPKRDLKKFLPNLSTLSKREWHLLIEWWFVISQFSLSNLSTMCVCGRCIDMARTSTETCSSRRWRCDDVFMCACSLVRLGCRV